MHFFRHCERSEAIQKITKDWIASGLTLLARAARKMTARKAIYSNRKPAMTAGLPYANQLNATIRNPTYASGTP
jgi:hypothetical protein